jgi:RNA polymerase sigma-70 factor (ECF subfamily)
MTPHSTFNTVRMHGYLERARAGDRQAENDLLLRVGGRLERLAAEMLRRFPNVARWVEADDVLQASVMRLLRSLHALEPANTREFMSLAALHIRRELLDLARHFRARAGQARAAGEAAPPVEELPSPEGAEGDLALWVNFHEAVERLPVGEREVVGLTFYHGWSQADIAALFGIDERTVRRRWRSACQKLADALDGRLPAH